VRRKAYVTSTAALLAALASVLAGCTGSGSSDGSPDDSKPQGTTTPAPAPPGKYRTLPEACTQVDQKTLDTMLPGIRTITDRRQREQAYAGTPTLSYETDRRTGCRWTGESPYATDHLLIDFERVVSYDTTVSDDSEAQAVFAAKETDAGVTNPPTPHDTPSGGADVGSGEGLSPDSATGDGTDGSDGESGTDASGDAYLCDAPGGGKDGSGTTGSPAALRPHALDDLGDAAFLDDTCTTPSSATRHRTVTVVFRTSNVIVTVQYDEQPTRPTDVPDSKKMQDTAEDLAHTLVGSLGD
jgi:hypothetical protein